MDIKVYYQKLRRLEAEISEPEVVMVSLDTQDGGRAGVWCVVGRESAARLLLEGRARLATAEEGAAYRDQLAEAKRAAEQAAAAKRMQITVISEADLKALRKKS
jgi:hypothetical protein